MTVRIRLQRTGLRNNPSYRIVAANARTKRDGKCLERLGSYNPVPDQSGTKHVHWNAERVQYWLSVGAQPSDTVARLLVKAGILPTPPPRYTTLPSVTEAAKAAIQAHKEAPTA
ncbi:ribosomal protein S16 domain-containing protein [Piptocephalis cylindrospora]|uniref:Ribosomal protein S16 domain-containing protein n=1 Tax=Piptocephalis cylindrospora TaxID=1907219 RepID=A0A4P9Y775_9FUNG|nr:ribosomal protein S16 domain-containing protein [Piptocephalis cylindrospora]|eukprot:RKP14967.1 ribosomal protein S16 domain-containing protein [Piptocephalis cylindrospora]